MDAAGPTGTVSSTLPEPPREIPEGFLERHAPSIGPSLKYAAVSIPLTSVPVVFGIWGIATGESAGRAGCAVLGGGMFLPIGVWFLYRAVSRWWELRGLYQSGDETEGTVTQVGSANYSFGGRSPTRIYYEFEVDGEIFTGEVDSQEVRRGEVEAESRVPVLYDMVAPERNVAVLGVGSLAVSDVWDMGESRAPCRSEDAFGELKRG